MEDVPRLPARLVRLAVEDPLRRPYLLTWKHDGQAVMVEGAVADRVRVALAQWSPAPYPSGPFVDVRRESEERAPSLYVSTMYRALPRGLGRELLLVCWTCDSPRRFLFGWEKTPRGYRRSSWRCRRCAGLRFTSEGRWETRFARHLRQSGMEDDERVPWDPYFRPVG